MVKLAGGLARSTTLGLMALTLGDGPRVGDGEREAPERTVGGGSPSADRPGPAPAPTVRLLENGTE